MERAADNVFLEQSLVSPPFHQWLRPELAELDAEAGRVVIRLRSRPEFRRSADDPALHGGVIASLIDIAAHAAVAARLGHGVPTIDLRIDYLRMAVGQMLLAEAVPIRFGRTTAVVDVKVTDEQARLVACGRGLLSTRNG
jgi:uncharacterized protein (TIGR00369 family)